MIVERHVFGSVKGYQTLARSPGVSNEQCRSLEGFSFGQPRSADYLNSLAKSPAFLIRPLAGGRRALTRLVVGVPDDRGRATLLLVTAVLASQDWDAILRGDVSLLLRAKTLWQWDRDPHLAPIDLPVSPPKTVQINQASADKLLALLSLIELRFGRQHSTVVRERDLTADEMRSLEMLIPPSVRFGVSLAYRSLNSRLGTTINCVADETPLDGSVELHVPGQHQRYAFYARTLEEAGLTQGRVDTAFVASYSGFGKYRPQPPGTPPSASAASQPVIVVPAPKVGSRVALIAGWALAVIFALLVVYVVRFRPPPLQPPTADQPVASETWDNLAELTDDLLRSKPLPANEKDRENVLKSVEALANAIPGESRDKIGLAGSLKKLRKAADELQQRLAKDDRQMQKRDAIIQQLLDAGTRPPESLEELYDLLSEYGEYSGSKDPLYTLFDRGLEDLNYRVLRRSLVEQMQPLLESCESFLEGETTSATLEEQIASARGSVEDLNNGDPLRAFGEKVLFLAKSLKQAEGRVVGADSVDSRVFRPAIIALQETLSEAQDLLLDYENILEGISDPSPSEQAEVKKLAKRLKELRPRMQKRIDAPYQLRPSGDSDSDQDKEASNQD